MPIKFEQPTVSYQQLRVPARHAAIFRAGQAEGGDLRRPGPQPDVSLTRDEMEQGITGGVAPYNLDWSTVPNWGREESPDEFAQANGKYRTDLPQLS